MALAWQTFWGSILSSTHGKCCQHSVQSFATSGTANGHVKKFLKIHPLLHPNLAPALISEKHHVDNPNSTNPENLWKISTIFRENHWKFSQNSIFGVKGTSHSQKFLNWQGLMPHAWPKFQPDSSHNCFYGLLKFLVPVTVIVTKNSKGHRKFWETDIKNCLHKNCALPSSTEMRNSVTTWRCLGTFWRKA